MLSVHKMHTQKIFETIQTVVADVRGQPDEAAQEQAVLRPAETVHGGRDAEGPDNLPGHEGADEEEGADRRRLDGVPQRRLFTF